MAAEGDKSQTARARARLALRAEQAWGANALPNVEFPEPAEAPDADVGATHPDAEAGTPARFSRSPVPATDPASDTSVAQAAARARSAQTDLFGVAAEARPASLAADDPPFSEPPPPRQKRIELLRALDEQEVKGCPRCPLCETRTHTVFGEGDPEARLMFIGEGPGENEDLSGRPFVGKAGGLLDKMIAGMGLQREQVYITNVVKCRPPGNRVPTALEVNTCTPYLHKQIEWIRPQVIVTLGLPATRHLLKSTLSMGRLRGQWHQWRGIKVMPTYHPAYLLRSYTESNRKTVWGDLQQVMAELNLSRPASSTRKRRGS